MWRWLSLISILLGLFIGLSLVLFHGYSESRKVNVIVLTVESLRRDLVSVENTPQLLAAAKKGLHFYQHHAVSGWTGANIVSLLSGISPFQAGVHTRGQSVDGQRDLPLETMAGSGYMVEGIQGFMTMDIYKNLGIEIIDPGQDLLYYLAVKIKKKAPFFLWYHYLHTHLPYRWEKADEYDFLNVIEGAGEGVRSRLEAAFKRPAIHQGAFTYQTDDRPYLDALHGMSVKEFDRWFAGFWEFYIKSGLSGNTVLVVTADHGDEHGERGSVGHASTSLNGHLHREIIEIPLFIWLPKTLKLSGNASVDRLSTHLDIMPTLFSILQIPASGRFEGRNLFGQKSASSWIGMTSSGGFSEKDPEHIAGYEYGIKQGRWKLLWYRGAAGEERIRLYDTLREPEEIVNLAYQEPLLTQKLHGLLQVQIDGKIHRPVRLDSAMVHSQASMVQWLFPVESGTYDFEQLAGRMYLRWQGDAKAMYRLQYQAGIGELALEGEIELQGTVKDFGAISRRYWDTWVVPYSPFRIRVGEAGKNNWSNWLYLEAR